MTPEQLDQDYQSMLAAIKYEMGLHIKASQENAFCMAQRASEAEKELAESKANIQRQLAELRDEKNKQISEYQAVSWKMAQRANVEKERAEHFKAERDALQARVDGALMALGETSKPALGQSFWRAVDKMVADQNKAIEILAGEGE